MTTNLQCDPPQQFQPSTPPKMTLNLKSLLAGYEKTLSAEKFANFKEHIENQIRRNVSDLAVFKPGAERGRRIHELIETETQSAFNAAANQPGNGIKISCRSGCAACCNFKVEITSDEADILTDLVKSGDAPLDSNRLLESIEAKSAKSVIDVMSSKSRCVFLSDENTCQVYSSRPSSCRRLLVTTDPKECYTAGGAPVSLAIPMVEVILSASINLPNNSCGILPLMLAQRLSILPANTSTPHPPPPLLPEVGL